MAVSPQQARGPGDGARDRMVTVVRRSDCSHGVLAVAAIRALADALAVSICVREITVESDEGARANRCLGSPTVLINGNDVEPAARARTSFGAT